MGSGQERRTERTRQRACIATWNIRSINTAVNKHALTLLMETESPEIAIITETWAEKEQPIHAKYDHFWSPPTRHQGVLVMTHKDMKFVPWAKEEWTNCMVSVRNEQFIVIGVYVPPNNEHQVEMKLRQLLRAATERRYSSIVVAGDLNDEKKELVRRLEGIEPMFN